MKSCLYEMTVMHERRWPKYYRFAHRTFMFYLDLSEVDEIARRWWLFGHNQPRVYDYREDDHINGLNDVLSRNGLEGQVASIKLLTNVRVFGYVFNPVSFYFCFDAAGQPLAVVVEIGNTFGEQKYFLLDRGFLRQDEFHGQQVKYYYISPFTELDNDLDFSIQVPSEDLKIGIDVIKDGKRFFFSSMLGKRKELSWTQLLGMTVAYPLNTLKVIALIHWHAAILHFVKHVPFHYKEEFPHMQKDIGKKKER